MTMGKPPWDTLTDKEIVCNATELQGDLGVHTSYSCLSHVDIGLMYKWFPGVNAAVWRGSTDKHCILCTMSGEPSSWKMTDSKGDTSYALYQGAVFKTIDDYENNNGDKDNDDPDDDDDDDHHHDPDGPGDNDDDYNKTLAKQRQLEYNETCSEWNAGVGSFRADPTNETLYAVVGNCISRSYDQAETWDGCWKAPGLVGSFRDVVVKQGFRRHRNFIFPRH
eukprot:gene57108-biopygen103432